MMTDVDREKMEAYLTTIDTLWKHAACCCAASECACTKGRDLIKKLIAELEKILIVEEE